VRFDKIQRLGAKPAADIKTGKYAVMDASHLQPATNQPYCRPAARSSWIGLHFQGDRPMTPIAASPIQPYVFRLTPAEWRALIEDKTFLRDPDNSYRPRRLMGVPVQIVPDHRLGPCPDPLQA
jgi:hypothetical protein